MPMMLRTFTDALQRTFPFHATMTFPAELKDGTITFRSEYETLYSLWA